MTVTTRRKTEVGNRSGIQAPVLGQAAQLAVLERLQTTLDLEQLLALMHEQVSHHLAVDGLEYHNESLGAPVMSGHKATHSCGYRLVNGATHLGELVFRRNRKFREKELALVETLIPLFLNPLRNAMRFRQAMERSFRDPVSGARNERSLWQILPREIALARRHNRPLSGLLIDIDDLGDTNRCLGHDAGDRVLEMVVELTGRLSRDTDTLFRVEDDTLLLLLQETGEDGARRLSERLMDACTGIEAEHDGRQLRPTISVACVTASGTDSADSFIARGLQHLQNR